MAKDKQEAISELRRFLGTDKDKFEVGGHEYTVLPLPARDAIEIIDSQYPIVSAIGPLFPEWRSKTDEYLKKAIRDKGGEAVSLDRALDEGWTVDDISDCLKRMARLSG